MKSFHFLRPKINVMDQVDTFSFFSFSVILSQTFVCFVQLAKEQQLEAEKRISFSSFGSKVGLTQLSSIERICHMVLFQITKQCPAILLGLRMAKIKKLKK